MLFNSLTFIVFFTIVLFLHNLPFSWRVKKRNLWMASYLFYAAWNPPFVLLLWISTLTDWVAAKRIARARRLSHRRFFLIISLCVNLGLLGYFKYGDFLLDNFILMMGMFDIHPRLAAPDVVLPVGISFYTFQSLSYTFDIYREKIEPWDSFSDFAMFVTFFPQLVAGPIVRAADFLPQCETPKKASARQISWALRDSSLEAVANRWDWRLKAAILAGLILAMALAPGDDRAFIYKTGGLSARIYRGTTIST
jgi:alginate O-acetyltransferase complex protein AlgI